MKRPIFSSTERDAMVSVLRGVVAVALAGAAALLTAALLSYDPRDPGAYTATWRAATNWLGAPGALAADFLMRTIGYAAYALAALAAVGALRIASSAGLRSLLGSLLAAPFAVVLLAAFASSHTAAAPFGGGFGGMLGDTVFGVVARAAPIVDDQLRFVVSTVFLAAAAALAAMLALGGRLGDLLALVGESGRRWRLLLSWIIGLASARRVGEPELASAGAAAGSTAPITLTGDLARRPADAPRRREPGFSDGAESVSGAARASAPLVAELTAPRVRQRVWPDIEGTRPVAWPANPVEPTFSSRPQAQDAPPALDISAIDAIARARAAADADAATRNQAAAPAAERNQAAAPAAERNQAAAPAAERNQAAAPAAERNQAAAHAAERNQAAAHAAERNQAAAHAAERNQAAAQNPPAPVATDPSPAAAPEPPDAPRASSTPAAEARAAREPAPAVFGLDPAGFGVQWRPQIDVSVSVLAAETPAPLVRDRSASASAQGDRLVEAGVVERLDTVDDLSRLDDVHDLDAFEGVTELEDPGAPDGLDDPDALAARTDAHLVARSETARDDLLQNDLLQNHLLQNDLLETDSPETAGDLGSAPMRDEEDALEDLSGYRRPQLDLLGPNDAGASIRITEQSLAEQADRLQSVLHDYGVRGEIIDVNPGPVVSQFELEPAPGLKASRVIGLAEDVARSMSAVAARISTIPGRNVIGVELPNEERETVLLRPLLEDPSFSAADARLPLALGRDIAGGPIVADLAAMPHLLIAGTTGSGKSVAINTMILSLLFKKTPEEVRLILIDPKMLELSVYNETPHLLSPVVTDPKQAVRALRWVVREMERRYQRMAQLNVRSIDSYNQKVSEAVDSGEVFERATQIGFDESTGEPIYDMAAVPLERLPLIVVVIDEMADLMLVAGKEIEHCIQRLAQMARASGIHLVMATQRPSVDVITGVIKANFPIRMSFQVTSKIDSRTILGENGAEQLLGKGDMLFTAGGGRLQRIHGPFASDQDVENVVAYLRQFGPADDLVSFDEEASASIADAEEPTSSDEAGDDALFERAVKLVTTERRASTSFLQRRLQLGYNRAARIVEMMEQRGVVSPANHVGKREVLAAEP